MKTAISKTKGFTLVELMVATLIIGILISLSIAASSGAKKSARDGKRKADLEQIRSALEMYKSDSDEGRYPTNAEWAANVLVTEGYMSELPSDPSVYSYYYNQISSNEYQLCAYLETGGSDNCGNNCGAPGNCNYEITNP